MNIKLIESGRKFSEKDISELEEFLSKLPYSHLQSLKSIEKVAILDDCIADSSLQGVGEEIRLSDRFYELDKHEREYALLHEMGHNYFDYKDENGGNRLSLRWGSCKKEDVSNLLRAQWMDLGLWELDIDNFEKVRALDPENRANRDKYTYITMYHNPNFSMGEWECPQEARIPRNSFRLSFVYDTPFYSPKEEMADAYTLFLLDEADFLRSAKANDIIQKKYDFIKRNFDDSKGNFKLT